MVLNFTNMEPLWYQSTVNLLVYLSCLYSEHILQQLTRTIPWLECHSQAVGNIGLLQLSDQLFSNASFWLYNAVSMELCQYGPLHERVAVAERNCQKLTVRGTGAQEETIETVISEVWQMLFYHQGLSTICPMFLLCAYLCMIAVFELWSHDQDRHLLQSRWQNYSAAGSWWDAAESGFWEQPGCVESWRFWWTRGTVYNQHHESPLLPMSCQIFLACVWYVRILWSVISCVVPSFAQHVRIQVTHPLSIHQDLMEFVPINSRAALPAAIMMATVFNVCCWCAASWWQWAGIEPMTMLLWTFSFQLLDITHCDRKQWQITLLGTFLLFPFHIFRSAFNCQAFPWLCLPLLVCCAAGWCVEEWSGMICASYLGGQVICL